MSGAALDPGEVAAYLAAADWAAAVLASAPVVRRWGDPSVLAGYSVGGLGAHLLQGVERLAQVLDAPAPTGLAPVGLVGFFGGQRIDDPAAPPGGLAGVLVAAAEARAQEGPTAIGRAFTDGVGHLAPGLAAQAAARPVPVLSVPGGAAPLDVYLRTRVVELLVHGDDLVASAGPAAAPGPPPGAAADVALGVVVALARARVGDAAVLAAFTRRERAEPGALVVF